MTDTKFNKVDFGCHIDGVNGIGGSMIKLGAMIDGLTDDQELLDILKSGDANKLSDDHSEFEDGADILQEITDEKYVWLWNDGDLILIDENWVLLGC